VAACPGNTVEGVRPPSAGTRTSTSASVRLAVVASPASSSGPGGWTIYDRAYSCSVWPRGSCACAAVADSGCGAPTV